MRNRNLLKVGFLAALLVASAVMSSCGKGDDPAPDNGGQQNPGGQDKPDGPVNPVNPDNPENPVVDANVTDLKCTVAEFAEKYKTLKTGVPVKVTLTDVSDANIVQVSEILRKMSQSAALSKAGNDAVYFLTLVLESVQNALKTIPADTFKGVEVLREVVIPACVEAIKSDAFAECVNLTVVKILGEETKVEETAFEGCSEEIKVEQVGDDKKVSLSFDGNGQKLGSAPEVVIYKDKTILPGQGSMKRGGYQFLGWAKSADAKKPDYLSGDEYSGSVDRLYAVWRNVQVFINYHGNYTNEDLVTNEFATTGSIIESPDYPAQTYSFLYSSYPVPEGMVFKCWKDLDGIYYNAGDTIVNDSDVDLYPVFEKPQSSFAVQPWNINDLSNNYNFY